MKLFLLSICTLTIITFSQAQSVGVGTATPNSSAILDVSSTNKGMLTPRMSTVQRNAIVNPTIGLSIFNTDDQCVDIYDGASWIKNCGLKKGPDVEVLGNNWVQKANFGGTARYGATAFSINTKGYITTGNDANGFKNDLWEYDPVTNAWTQKADFGGVARAGAIGFSIGSKGYAGLGQTVGSPGTLLDFWEYDQLANSWTQRADFAGPMRTDAVGLSIGSKGYVGTGSISGAPSKDFWEFDPALNTWTQKANVGSTGRRGAFAFTIGTKGYIGSGFDCCSGFNDFWEYDQSTNTWTQKANFSGTARGQASAFSIGTSGYVGTGFTGNSVYSNDFWEYNSLTNSWIQRATYSGVARFGAIGFALNNRGYIGTGTDFVSHKGDFWEYDKDAFFVPTYTTITTTTAQGNISDGIWSRTVLNDITSSGNKFKITSDGKIGVNTTSPNYPLSFTDSTGDKIGLNSAAGNHFGIGIQNQLLQLYSENSSADIAFGYGSSGSFTERMRIKGNGSVGIGVNPASFSSAILDISSTSKGVLIPRMNTIQRNAIASPVLGLTIFNTDDFCTDTYDGTKWIKNCGLKQLDSLAMPGNSWVQKNDMNLPARSGASAFSIGTKGYITGGFTSQLNDLWEYDQGTNAWSQKANFAGLIPRAYAVAFSIGTKGYVGTGFSGSIRYNDLWEYDPSTNNWTQKANFSGTAREGAVGFSIGTKGYIGTGWDGTTKNDFWEYDPSANSWTSKTNFAGGARYGASGFAFGTKGYITTGVDNTNNTKKDIWEYDQTANTWTQRTDLPAAPRYRAVAFSSGNKGFVGTGEDFFGNNKTDFWEFDPAVSGYWTQRPDFGGGLRNTAVAFSIGTKGYIATGFSTANQKDIWEYNTQAFNSAVYSSVPEQIQQNTVTDGIWTKTAVNDIISKGDKVKISVAGNIGVNNLSPGFPLNFSPVNGDKISLYGNSGNHFGLGIQTALLQIHTDLPSSDIAFGTGSSAAFAEVMRIKGNGALGIGTSTPNTTSLVDMNSVTRGVLIPRMSTAQRNAIVSPATGLMVLNTDDLCTDVYDGTNWIKNCGLKIQGDSATVSANNWLQKSNLGSVNRTDAAAFSINSKGYVAIGTSGGPDLNDLWEFDPSGNIWSQKANYPGAGRVNSISFAIGTKGYVGMGSITPSSFFQTDFWEYDAAANNWTQKASFGSIRNAPVSFAIGSKGYLATGFAGTYTNELWEYNPATNLWTQKTSLPGSGRLNAVGFSIGTKGYVGLGDFNVSALNDFWEYDPAGNSWTQKANFAGVVRIKAAGFGLGSKGYVGTGQNLSGTTFYDDFWEFDPAANTWTQKTNYSGTPRSDAASFAIGTKGYIGAGTIGTFSYKNDFWEYNAQAYLAPTYSTASSPISQVYNVSDGKWTKTLSNDLISYGDKMKIASDGNVGIGTLSPGYPLNFSSTVGDKISLYGNSGAHYGFGIQSALLQIYSDASIANIAFGYGNSSSFNERARIINSGEYGMSIRGRLQLTTGVFSAGMWLTNTANTINAAFIGMASDNIVGFYGATGGFGLEMNTATGNVGIGMNGGNPAKPLSFAASLGEKILLYPGGTGEVGIGVYGNELRLHCDNPGSMVSFGTQDNAGNFTQAGRFQISAPYALYVNGSIWANGTTYASDERFKKNITPIISPLQKILQLKGVEYEMDDKNFSKNNFPHGRQIGLIAQNVEKIVPEAVNEIDGYKGVDYARLVPLLIESIRELNNKIDEQNKTIELLKAKVN
jgi:N-acetylneuraminic acid mutarotase